MRYEKSLMAYWDEYAIRKAAKDEGREEGHEEIIKSILATGKFTVAEIARLTKINQAFIRKLKKQLSPQGGRSVEHSTQS